MFESPELDEAIERLYRAFASYALPANTDPCPCCHSAKDEAKLHARPLRELGAEHLTNYAGEALRVWGDENVFKHFFRGSWNCY